MKEILSAKQLGRISNTKHYFSLLLSHGTGSICEWRCTYFFVLFPFPQYACSPMLSIIFIRIYLNQYYCLDITSCITYRPIVCYLSIYDLSTSVLHFEDKRLLDV